jgi:hypothetical protein
MLFCDVSLKTVGGNRIQQPGLVAEDSIQNGRLNLCSLGHATRGDCISSLFCQQRQSGFKDSLPMRIVDSCFSHAYILASATLTGNIILLSLITGLERTTLEKGRSS